MGKIIARIKRTSSTRQAQVLGRVLGVDILDTEITNIKLT